jgi:hypothetical protein
MVLLFGKTTNVTYHERVVRNANFSADVSAL